MIVKRSRVLAISATAIAALLAAAVPQASAQTLMDLFRGNKERRSEPVEIAPPARPAVPPRVTGPSYYAYKADPLVRVDFSAIRPERVDHEARAASEAIDPQPVGATQSVLAGTVETAQLLEIEGPALVESAQETPASQPLTDAQITALQGVELLAEKQAAEAIVAYYSQTPELIWVSDGKPNDQARATLQAFAAAGDDGLNPDDYAVSLPAEGDERALIAFEMKLSARLLRYARDVRSGRVDPNKISGYHDFKPKGLDRVAVLREARGSEDIAAFLEAGHPQNAQYKALRAELAALRKAADNDVVIAPGTLIRPGQTDGEFPKLLRLIDQRADAAFREAHAEVLARHLGSETYAQELVPLIKAAQKAAGVGDDGVIGTRTILAIAGESKQARIEKVEIAMEQVRWLPSDLSDRYVFINTPAFEATYVEDGEEKLSMRTVVGNLATQTYFFQDEIQYVEFHPYWGVPRSILVNKYLPKLYSDPAYLDRNGFEVVDRQGRAIASSSIDWTQYGANIPYDVRQRPGRGNALGEMKIMFPNKHAIYMHDTPDKHLFERDNRALSNGCIRLADPRAMAAAVLGWDTGDVVNRLDRPHSRENLAIKVPVYVAYFTAWPDQAGEVEYYSDVYGRDEKTRAAIDKVEALRSPGA